MGKLDASAIVVGGGLIGRAVAFKLASRADIGSVRILERRTAARPAYAPPSGLASPGLEAVTDGHLDLYGFHSKALESLERLLDELADAGARPIAEAPGGALVVARQDLVARRLIDTARVLRRDHGEAEVVTPLDLPELEPALDRRIAGGVFFPHARCLSVFDLLEALGHGLRRRGVQIEEGRGVTELIQTGPTVEGVRTPEGEERADLVIVCAGAWAEPVLPVLGIEMPLVVRRRHHIEIGPGGPNPRRTVMTQGLRLGPVDARLQATGPGEAIGFDESVTLGGISQLGNEIEGLIPGSSQRPLLIARASLSGAIVDGAPLIGPAPAAPGAFAATGAGTRGLLTCAVIAELLEWAVDGRERPQWATVAEASRTPGRSSRDSLL